MNDEDKRILEIYKEAHKFSDEIMQTFFSKEVPPLIMGTAITDMWVFLTQQLFKREEDYDVYAKMLKDMFMGHLENKKKESQ